MTPRLPQPPWQADRAAMRVVAALTAQGQTVRFVGGCVRDAMLGLPYADIDLATPDPPDRVMALARGAGLAVAPTGLAHGTVTVIADRHPVEVTTLRRDLAGDGRHAEVAFTDDWAADAARRDFTINALYADPDGTLVDLVGGLDDLAHGRVRFIGDAAARLAEDYLRILRFFRFYGRFGRGTPDPAALTAIAAAAAGLARLSAERIRDELLKCLVLDRAGPVMTLMADQGVLTRLLADAVPGPRFQALLAIEGRLGEADALRRLVALLPPDPAAVAAAARRLKLSNAQRERAAGAARIVPGLDPDLPQPLLRRHLYRLGRDRVGDLVRLAWAARRAAGLAPDDAAWRQLVGRVAAFARPTLPVDGRDILALQVPEGAPLGALLGRIEQWWLDHDMTPDRAACLAELRGWLGSGP